MTEPSIAVENFSRLLREHKGDPEVERENRAAWSDSQGMIRRTDEAVIRVQFAMVGEAVEAVRIRRKSEKVAAIQTLGGCWINGYVLARTFYRSALSALQYSNTDDDIQKNGQRLIDYAESIDLDSVLTAASEGVAGAAASMLSGSDARMARKYGRMWQSAGVTCYANGIRIGIAEYELFGHPEPPV